MDQLDEWAKGNSIHAEQCCPDFSCCDKQMNTPVEVKERFMKAVREQDDKTRMEMLGMFLGQAMQTLNKKVYVAGTEIPEGEQ